MRSTSFLCLCTARPRSAMPSLCASFPCRFQAVFSPTYALRLNAPALLSFPMPLRSNSSRCRAVAYLCFSIARLYTADPLLCFPLPRYPTLFPSYADLFHSSALRGVSFSPPRTPVPCLSPELLFDAIHAVPRRCFPPPRRSALCLSPAFPAISLPSFAPAFSPRPPSFVLRPGGSRGARGPSWPRERGS